MPTERPPYPGHLATDIDLLRLADEYRCAAITLEKLGRRRQPISRAPYRFAAIHAIELYLNAVLLRFGHAPAAVRGLQHDLAARTDRAVVGGLVLRKRTEAHLRAMASAREYQISRYGAEMAVTLSQVNRLEATLEDVAAKVRALICCDENTVSDRVAAGATRGSSAWGG